jgi:hypothetical protein
MVEAQSALRDDERASKADTASPTAAMEWFRALREIEPRLIELAAKTQCSAHEHRGEASRSWVGREPFQQKAVDHLDGSALSHPWCPPPAVSLMESFDTAIHPAVHSAQCGAHGVDTVLSVGVRVDDCPGELDQLQVIRSQLFVGIVTRGTLHRPLGRGVRPLCQAGRERPQCREESVTPSLRALWSAWWGRTPKPEDLKHRLGARTQALKVDVPVARW